MFESIIAAQTAGAPTFWPTVAGASVALAGVIIADIRNSRRQRIQHEFEANQKKIDRITALRQELYAPMADVIRDAMTFLIKLPEVRIENGKLVEEVNPTEPLGKLNSATAKLIIIAEASTAVLAQQLDWKISQAHSILLGAAQPLKNCIMQVKATSLSKDVLEREFDRVQAALDLHFESGKQDNRAWAALQSQQEKYLSAIEEREEAHLSHLKSEAEQKVLYLKIASELMPEIEDLSLNLLASMRSELTGGTDSSTLALEFLRQLRVERKRLKTEFEEAINRVESIKSDGGHEEIERI